MPRFLLLLHDDRDALARISPDEMQRIISEYQQWSERLAAAGKLAGGEKLRDDGGKHLARAGGKVVVRDGPFAEAKEVVGGYFILVAADETEAVALASACPHVLHGGRVELREIEELGQRA